MGVVVRIIGALRVKNESRWLARVLESIEPLCDDCFVFDDHSEDTTPQIASEFGANVLLSPFQGLDEARDKDFLLDHVRAAYPNCWVLMIDGDEVLEPGGAEKIRESIESGRSQCYSLKVKYIWDRPDQWRTDGIYARFARPSLFHALPGVKFARTRAGGNFHCSNAPVRLMNNSQPSGASLLHYGYFDQAERIRKFHWYNAADPNNPVEDGYRHMVIGDLFPAGSVFRHGGPLKLEALCTAH